jgi:CheY-like chemotaxis protein
MIRPIRPRVLMETILLVDDNPLRASLRQSLLEGGNVKPLRAVVRALDASEALCMVEAPEFAQNLGLVITGHKMSGISGPEFVAEFRSRMPQVPVLVLSSAVDAEKEYSGIDGVYNSQSNSPDELRSLVGRLVSANQRQTA